MTLYSIQNTCKGNGTTASLFSSLKSHIFTVKFASLRLVLFLPRVFFWYFPHPFVFIVLRCLKNLLIPCLCNCQMVRVLVATSIREAAAGAENDALLNLLEASSRRATAPPAPSEGLCLFDVGYADFDPQTSLIH